MHTTFHWRSTRYSHQTHTGTRSLQIHHIFNILFLQWAWWAVEVLECRCCRTRSVSMAHFGTSKVHAMSRIRTTPSSIIFATMKNARGYHSKGQAQAWKLNSLSNQILSHTRRWSVVCCTTGGAHYSSNRQLCPPWSNVASRDIATSNAVLL